MLNSVITNTYGFSPTTLGELFHALPGRSAQFGNREMQKKQVHVISLKFQKRFLETRDKINPPHVVVINFGGYNHFVTSEAAGFKCLAHEGFVAINLRSIKMTISSRKRRFN